MYICKWTAQSNPAVRRYCGGSGLFAFRISWSPARALALRCFTTIPGRRNRIWPNLNSFFYWTMWCWGSNSCPQGNWMSMPGQLLSDSMLMKTHLLVLCWFEFCIRRSTKIKEKVKNVFINTNCLSYNRDAFRISWTRLSMDESKRPTPAACTDRVNSVRRRAPKDRRSRATFATPAPHTWPIPPTGWPTLTITTTSPGGSLTRCSRASSTRLKSTWLWIYVSLFLFSLSLRCFTSSIISLDNWFATPYLCRES